MENEIKLFYSEQFGDIRTTVMKNELWFIGKDIAECLGYANTRDALIKHVDNEDKANVAIYDGRQNRNMVIINESGLYSLIMNSKLPTAKSFKHWVTSEVLPSIRKTGTYDIKQPLSIEDMMIKQLEEQKKIKNRIEIVEDKLNNQLTIDHGKQRLVQRAVAVKVYNRLDENKTYSSCARVFPSTCGEISRKYFAALYRDLKNRFGVGSYRDLKEKDYELAINFINSWVEDQKLRNFN